MLKLMLFAFLMCGAVSAASAMGAWMVQPDSFPGVAESLFGCTSYEHAFLISLALLCGLGASLHQALAR